MTRLNGENFTYALNFGIQGKPDVSRITLDVGSGTDTEVDAAEFFPGTGMKHTEVPGGHTVDHVMPKVCEL